MDAAQPAQCVEGLVGDIREESAGRVHGDRVKQREAPAPPMPWMTGNSRSRSWLTQTPSAICTMRLKPPTSSSFSWPSSL
jgi:hypothetical protein